MAMNDDNTSPSPFPLWTTVSIFVALLVIGIFLNFSSTINLWASKINPQTLEFYKAVLTVIVALIAAVIAGGIQYRQWQTAHKQWQTAQQKLNSDLFDRRFNVYLAAFSLYEELLEADNADDWYKIKDKFYTAVLPARWILNEEIADYLRDQYMESCISIAGLIKAGPDDESEKALAAFHKRTDKCNEDMNLIIKKVRKMLNPYLRLDLIK